MKKRCGCDAFEGEQGLQYVFDDIIKQRADVLLFRSLLDTSTPGISKMLDEHKERRKRLGLTVCLVSPRKPTRELLEWDKGYNMIRRYLPEEKFSIPAQINVYANKVAITSYGMPMVTTVIESPEIKNSFATLFELVWSQAVAPEKVLG